VKTIGSHARYNRPLLIGAGLSGAFIIGLLASLYTSRPVPAQPKPNIATAVSNPGSGVDLTLFNSNEPANVFVKAGERQFPSWDASWRYYCARPSSAERDSVLAAKLKELSAVNANAAAERLRDLHPNDRVSVVAATLRAATRKGVDEVVEEAVRLCDEDPSYSLEYGRILISTLASTGDYHAALRFVLAEEADGWLGENGNKWLTSLFTTWAKANPAQAMNSAQMVPAGLRGEALQAAAAVWAQTDLAGLSDFLCQLSTASDRNLVVDTAWRSF
jgi:hypothetical protein